MNMWRAAGIWLLFVGSTEAWRTFPNHRWPYMAASCLYRHRSQLLVLLCLPDSWAVHQPSHKTVTQRHMQHNTHILLTLPCSLNCSLSPSLWISFNFKVDMSFCDVPPSWEPPWICFKCMESKRDTVGGVSRLSGQGVLTYPSDSLTLQKGYAAFKWSLWSRQGKPWTQNAWY